MRKDTWTTPAAVAALVVALSLAAAACSDDGEPEAQATRPTVSTPTERTATRPKTTGQPGKRSFAEFRLVFDPSTLDSLDPGISFTVPGWQTLWNVHLGLVGYKHVSGPEGAELVPYLAEELPEVSSDARTYSFRLRNGLRYSDGKAVKASDFEASIKRLFLMDSLGRDFFRSIEGAARFDERGKGDISGIETDDKARTIEIALTEPRGDFMHILATTFAALTPAGTAARPLAGQAIPSTGPYRITRHQPGGGFTLERNPHFRATGSVPATNPDRIVAVAELDPAKALDRVLKGDIDYTLHLLPGKRLAELRRDHPDQLRTYAPANTYYVFMNTRTPPFDKLAVRQAVNYAIDRGRMARLYGGLARPTENVLPPTYPAYRKLRLYPRDVGRARRLVRQAGASRARVTVWTSDRATSQPQAAYLVQVLRSIGLRAQIKVVPQAVYWTTIGNQRTRAQIGLANWFQDYPHPLDWFDVLLNGDRISPTNNQNYANANVPALNRRIEELKRRPTLTDAVNAEWAKVDRMVLEQALWAPFANREFVDFFASDVDVEGCYVNHVLFEFDFGQICRKAA
jgi:peptide/nickel transport system substrate-binding protein